MKMSALWLRPATPPALRVRCAFRGDETRFARRTSPSSLWARGPWSRSSPSCGTISATAASAPGGRSCASAGRRRPRSSIVWSPAPRPLREPPPPWSWGTSGRALRRSSSGALPGRPRRRRQARCHADARVAPLPRGGAWSAAHPDAGPVHDPSAPHPDQLALALPGVEVYGEVLESADGGHDGAVSHLRAPSLDALVAPYERGLADDAAAYLEVDERRRRRRSPLH